MSSKKQGFASFTKEKHLAASSVGGSRKVPKGFAMLSPEERTKNASIAGTSRWAKHRVERSKRATINPKGDGRS